MLKIRRFGILAPIGLAIALLVAGLPTLGFSIASAQYYYSSGSNLSPEGAFGNNLPITARVKVYAAVPCYADPGLTQPIVTLNGPNKAIGDTFTSYLVDPAVNGSKGYYRIWVGSANACYISSKGTTLVPR